MGIAYTESLRARRLYKAAKRGIPIRDRGADILRLQRMPYDGYLQSAWWKFRKRQAIVAAGCRCQDCGNRKRLDVHHLSYKRVGHEQDADLIALCRSCHDKRHEH